MNGKSPQAFRTISEVAEELDLPQHVLRFWETKFSQIRPMKRSSGRRFYRPEDVELVRAIRDLLYGQGYTIRGVQKLLKERGVREFVGVAASGPPAVLVPPNMARDDLMEVDGAQVDGAQDDIERERDEISTGPDHPQIAVHLRGELQTIRDEVLACARLLEEARQL